jgi:hypothetical protein
MRGRVQPGARADIDDHGQVTTPVAATSTFARAGAFCAGRRHAWARYVSVRALTLQTIGHLSMVIASSTLDKY